MSPKTLENLAPELQEFIIGAICDAKSLYALLRASPNCYRLFSLRRNVYLTELARRQFHPDVICDAWDTVKASQLPRRPTGSDMAGFCGTLARDMNLEIQYPLEMSIRLCKLSNRVDWCVQEFSKLTLSLLDKLGETMQLDQDSKAIHATLSATETGRLQRAFCRFETNRYLKPHRYGQSNKAFPRRTEIYLKEFEDCEVEEIVSIRDFLALRVLRVFQDIESPPVSMWKTSETRFKYDGIQFIDDMLSLGLPFLQELFQSDRTLAAELVLKGIEHQRGFPISGTYWGDPSNLALEVYITMYTNRLRSEFQGDEIGLCSMGWLWAHYKCDRSRDHRAFVLRDLRDCGYVFWDAPRLSASGILRQE